MANDNPTEQNTQPNEAQRRIDAGRPRNFLTEEQIDDLVREQNNEYESDNKPTENKGMAMAYKPERSAETQAAFDYLEGLLTKDGTPTTARIAAAQAILDHAHL